ncbi:MAG: hypothetical protein P4L44_03160 [Oryzomonas sp.]|uniref:hypothetical protein n=1 Tax=Oryzomonas sp. TaxID=2855186 RepID=UPI00284502C4|nr:hypothetical protein [Oryzomonas sp.]MDR3578944.1 hypothetical protein [Oryzomonas sp.]
MNHIKAIFIRFFLSIFVVLLILISLVQYADTKKLDLKFSLPFCGSLALLGATIAAIFIGTFRKIESEPPRVQLSEYLQVDNRTIEDGLAAIKRKRIVLVTMFCMWIPYGMLITILNFPEAFIFAYMAGMVIVGFMLQFAKCPRCGHYFQFRTFKDAQSSDRDWERISLLFGGGYHNTFTKKCLNCGLNLKVEKNI